MTDTTERLHRYRVSSYLRHLVEAYKVEMAAIGSGPWVTKRDDSPSMLTVIISRDGVPTFIFTVRYDEGHATVDGGGGKFLHRIADEIDPQFVRHHIRAAIPTSRPPQPRGEHRCCRTPLVAWQEKGGRS